MQLIVATFGHFYAHGRLFSLAVPRSSEMTEAEDPLSPVLACFFFLPIFGAAWHDHWSYALGVDNLARDARLCEGGDWSLGQPPFPNLPELNRPWFATFGVPTAASLAILSPTKAY